MALGENIGQHSAYNGNEKKSAQIRFGRFSGTQCHVNITQEWRKANFLDFIWSDFGNFFSKSHE